jgi:hypothetical protein
MPKWSRRSANDALRRYMEVRTSRCTGVSANRYAAVKTAQRAI